MNETFEKIYNENNTGLNEDTALFEKVYAEVEMLNEMNPKLRALLAAGLIGTAGLGAVSCSVDGSYDESPVEQPAPETPDTPDTPETENTEETALSGFKKLGVEGYAESLARTQKKEPRINLGNFPKFTVLIYKNGFIPVEFDENNTYEDGQAYVLYVNFNDKIIFYVPESMESDFDQAITVYKAVHAE